MAENESEAAEYEEAASEPKKKRSKLKLIIFILLPLLLLGGGGGGVYFYMFAGADDNKPKEEPELPAPSFVDVKPFVVSLKADDGSMHFAQIALSLRVPGAPAVEAVNQVLPEVQDTMRLIVLSHKADQLETSDGVDKLRVELLGGVNGVLKNALGATKLKKLTGSDTDDAVVKNVYFSNLVIE
jgi:flagellar protein FliL